MIRTHDLAQAAPYAIALHRTAHPARSDDTETCRTGRGVPQNAQQHKLPMHRSPIATHPLKLGRTEKTGGLWKSQVHFLRHESDAAPEKAAAGKAGAGAQACVCRA